MSAKHVGRFPVEIASESYFDGIENSEIVFHAINKSGSLAMEQAIREAFDSAGRSNELLSHYKLGCPIDEFIEMVNAKRSRFVVAHDLYGSLEPRENRVWVTQFRHPLPKLLSSYRWIKRKNEAAGLRTDATLIDFVQRTGGTSHSLVCQFGSANWHKYRRRWRRESAATAESLYYASIDVLENEVHTISLAERFEESIFLFAKLCGLSSVAPWVRDDRNPGRTLAWDITEQEREVVEDVFRYDYLLYKYAVERFEGQLAQLNFGSSLAEYKEACADQYKDRILISTDTDQPTAKTGSLQAQVRRLINEVG